MPNKLIHEQSPYLLQHAHNPVEWFPWGEEAFNKARTEDKPILVSIGYAACHWCHVMEHESFENEATAKFMNNFFVNIKIDREERPDLDNIYMNACQILTGAGGWPLNVFLTPELKPFSAGTYYPPKPGYGKPSWMEVLTYMHQVFTKQRDKVEEQAQLLSDHIVKMDAAFIEKVSIPEGANIFKHADAIAAVKGMQNQFDTTDGGFGNAPKFPAAMTLRFLWRYAWFTNDEAVKNHVTLSLDQMYRGGIYDHIGGGFARYATDKKWLIPHFEKMLYDNALLCSLYAEVYRATGNETYLQVVNEIMQYVNRECTAPDGGWYASYDADSEGEEGKYYLFSPDDLSNALGSDAGWAATVYHLTQTHSREFENLPHRLASDEVTAQQMGMPLRDFKEKLSQVKNKMLAYREQRIKPGLDNKIILGWNALMCTATVDAFKATGNESYRKRAVENITFLTTAFPQNKNDGAYNHVITNDIKKYPAFLEDYAALIQALFDVFEITGDTHWYQLAKESMQYVKSHFPAADSMFYFTEKNQADIPIRSAEFYDNATPSGNSMMASNYFRSFHISGNIDDAQQAELMLSSMRTSMIKYGTSFGNWWLTALKYIYPPAEVAVTGPNHTAMRDEIFNIYYPHIFIQNGNAEQTEFPLLQQRHNQSDTRIFVCHNFVCNQPVTTVQDFSNALKALAKE